uniref:Putative secreted protein n=1 Tax=Amblyomma americanum TaxID=6943 RepID=A0A0C9R5B6_AMBAM
MHHTKVILVLAWLTCQTLSSSYSSMASSIWLGRKPREAQRSTASVILTVLPPDSLTISRISAKILSVTVWTLPPGSVCCTRESRDISMRRMASLMSSFSTTSPSRSLARAVERRRMASRVLGDMKVASLLLRASLRIST